MSGRFDMSTTQAIELIGSLPVVPKPISSIYRSDEVGEHIVWTVNDEYILRVPVNQTDRQLLRERELLDLVRRQTVADSAIPLCLDLGQWGEQGAFYALYKKINGVSIEKEPDKVTEEMDKGLGLFLEVLKGVKIEDAEAIRLSRAEQVDLDELRAKALIAWKRLRTKGQIGDFTDIVGIEDWIETPAKMAFQPVLSHADLKGEHIFIDPNTGRLTGVIDWSDAQIGCPSVDIGGLAISVGAKMAVSVALRIGYSREIATKGVFLARCNAIVLLDERLNGVDDSPEWLLRNQLRRAFESVN